jgi:hypothetical protein
MLLCEFHGSKIVLLLNLESHHDDIWGLEVQCHVFLSLNIHRDEWSASRLGRITPEENL